MRTSVENENVTSWWEKHPFTYGLSDTGDLVGRIPIEKMDRKYFDEIERKFRKHSRGGGQEEGAPLLSNLVDYSWLNRKRVLDIACGSGFSTVAFAEGGAEVTAIDVTAYAVNQTKKNLELRGLSGKALQMDAQHLDFPDGSFDFVNAWGCLMHMPDTKKAIKETYRVLKPGGKCLAYMYNRSSWPFWFNIIFLRGVLLLGLIRYRFDVERLTARYSDGATLGGNVKATFYTPKRVRHMFLDAGFEEAVVFPWHLPDEPNHWPMRKLPFFKFLPKSIKEWMAVRWGYGLIVQAQK